MTLDTIIRYLDETSCNGPGPSCRFVFTHPLPSGRATIPRERWCRECEAVQQAIERLEAQERKITELEDRLREVAERDGH